MAFTELELNWLEVDMVPALVEFRGKKKLNNHSSAKWWLSQGYGVFIIWSYESL